MVRKFRTVKHQHAGCGCAQSALCASMRRFVPPFAPLLLLQRACD